MHKYKKSKVIIFWEQLLSSLNEVYIALKQFDYTEYFSRLQIVY